MYTYKINSFVVKCNAKIYDCSKKAQVQHVGTNYESKLGSQTVKYRKQNVAILNIKQSNI